MKAGIEMGLFKKYVSQTRKPEGFLGKMMLNGMNNGHAKMADWGMSYLKDISPKNIAELGCGGGRNAGELMKRFPDSHLTAVDYSSLSVEKAAEYNKSTVDAGRCTVQQGDVSALDLEKEHYDLATAFETVYFWKNLVNCFEQVAGILKTGGTFMIVNESDGTDKASLGFEKIIEGMKCYTAQEIGTALKKAGFSVVRAFHHKNKPWIVVIARK